ncbi:hypothetical protein [Streptomyces sp. NPDC005385]|uniref:hypothetical protein n=1 Tax=Streptomyces sp. NPDC005385 TaxID=3157039 RepID=UPI0033ADAF7D
MPNGDLDPSESLPTIRRQLQRWETRRREFLGNPADPGQLTTDLTNTTHLFAYLDGNRRHLDFRHLTPYREALDADTAQLGRLLPDAWGAALRTHAVARAGWREEEALLSTMSAARERLTTDRATLLSTLKVSAAGGPETAFARLIGGLQAADSRRKLATVWERLSDKALPALTEATDRVIDARWSRARAAGHASPLAATLQRSRIDEHTAEAFLTDYLTYAVTTHRGVEATVSDATGCPDDPMTHFAAYLNSIASGERMPSIPLSACVDTAMEVIENVFGHRTVREDYADTVVLTLWSADSPKGTIQVDCAPLQSSQGADLPADLPIGRALARCRSTAVGRTLTFEGAHSLMHEFGHAVNHVLLDPRPAGSTGVEYLPVERLEDLSAWFEKWVNHPRFIERVPAPDRGRLPLAARIKATEFHASQLQRAVVALMDFRLHQTETSVTSAFHEVCAEAEAEGLCHLADLVPHFGAAVFRAHPGLAGLCYVRSYAFAAETFRLADPREALRPCLDPTLASATLPVPRWAAS